MQRFKKPVPVKRSWAACPLTAIFPGLGFYLLLGLDLVVLLCRDIAGGVDVEITTRAAFVCRSVCSVYTHSYI